MRLKGPGSNWFGNFECRKQCEPGPFNYYHVKGSAENGIASVQSNCGADERYEKTLAANGKHYFNLKAANHQVIGTSQMYASADSRDAGVASVKSNGTTTTVKDKT
jgi:uncharacterized protein YegP (UPF0339 family)